ncbi:MAG: tol-pal system protein YbgF [Chlorobiaceae bacterium]|nr:tol-pal system protein YbgF [Chlorobiaceae bacterium]
MLKTRPTVFLLIVLLSACATQKDMKYVQGEVTQLRNESRVIKQQSAGSYSEITQYREEIASLRGGLNELGHHYRGSMKRLDMEDSLLVVKSSALESRISKIEQYLALESAGSSKVPSPVIPVPAALIVQTSSPSPEQPTGEHPIKTPTQQIADTTSRPVQPLATQPSSVEDPVDALLNQGLVRMKNEDYSGARKNFQAFMKQNPKSPKTADAQFFVAESWYGEKWYEKAILEYQVIIEKYTKNEKRPAALYKQGLAFEKIGEMDNAKARYKDVVNLYPATPEARLARKSLGIK